MTQKRRKADSGKAIGEMMALRWEPTHVTKPNPRVVPLQIFRKNSMEFCKRTILNFTPSIPVTAYIRGAYSRMA